MRPEKNPDFSSGQGRERTALEGIQKGRGEKKKKKVNVGMAWLKGASTERKKGGVTDKSY